MSETIQSEFFVENGDSFRRIIYDVPNDTKSLSIWADHRSVQESDDDIPGQTGTLGHTVIWINHMEIDNHLRREDGTYQYRFDRNFDTQFNGTKIEVKILAENIRMILQNFELYLVIER